MEEQTRTSFGRVTVQLCSFCYWRGLRVAVTVEEIDRSFRQFWVCLPEDTVTFQGHQPRKVDNGLHPSLLRPTQPIPNRFLRRLAKQGQLHGPTAQKIARILEGLRILSKDKKKDLEIAKIGLVEIQIRCGFWRRVGRRHADCSQWIIVVLLIIYACVLSFFLEKEFELLLGWQENWLCCCLFLFYF